MLSGGLVVCKQHSQRLVELLLGLKQDTGLTEHGAPGRHCLGLVGVWLRHCSPDWDGDQPWEEGAGRGGGGAGARLTRTLWHSALLYPPLSLSIETI